MCVVLPERMHIGQLTLRWTTIGNVLGSQDEGLNSFVDEGLRIKEERLNSTDSDTSETKVISPSSCVLYLLSKENVCQYDGSEDAEEVGYQSAEHRIAGVLDVHAAEIDSDDIEGGVGTALHNAH